MNKILLINLPTNKKSQEIMIDEVGYNPSLGLLSMGTFLELNGYEPLVIDLSYERSITLTAIINTIREEKPFLIGISSYTVNSSQAMFLAETLKKSFADLKIVLGGPHPSLLPEECIKPEYIDFVIIKEGEATILELSEAILSNETVINYEDIRGLVFKREGKVIKNKLRQPIRDLDLLPIIKRELAGIEKYENNVNIISSRGCPGNCIYCAAAALSGASYRTRDIENVFMELIFLKVLLEDRLRSIYFMDDTFTAIPNRVEAFVDMAIRYDMGVPWKCESRVEVMTKELLDKMALGGCTTIVYGIESGNQDILDKIQKNIKLDYTKEILEATIKSGITMCLNFMLGHYCDTKKTMEDTLNFIKQAYKLYKPIISLTFNTPYPGTWQHTHKEELGLRYITEDYDKYTVFDPIVETENFTVKDQIQFFYRAAPYLWRKN
ncbi:B12-binding domain-containing radical SAM protein [Clostridium thermarum]|uniref:B12-binding domain-containing radical SAM protein n=1 Tax=Clostridium thermarum TaxID=1716543 RepID=UPI0013D1C5E7|nr:radical SAM protein [Clostridium thermarum]